MIFVNDSDFEVGYANERHAASKSIVNKLFRKRALKETNSMEHTIVTLEPDRQNKLLRWWADPEAGTLLQCLAKAQRVMLIEAAELQGKSLSEGTNAQLNLSAAEKLKEAADFETAIKVLNSFFPDGPFIARIEL